MKTKYMASGFEGISHGEEMAFDVLIHVCILTLVLTLFFWVVISPLAKKTITREMQKAVNEAAESVQIPDKNSTLEAALETAAIFYETPDKVTEKIINGCLG